jgi:hypothetical protein
MNWLTRILIKLGILKDDLDYHVVRASMVVIFALFGYSKWFNYEAQALIPLITHGPFNLLAVPGFRHPGRRPVLRGCRVVVWHSLARRILE